MQAYQQTCPWVGKEDPGKGNKLPAYGKYPKVKKSIFLNWLHGDKHKNVHCASFQTCFAPKHRGLKMQEKYKNLPH